MAFFVGGTMKEVTWAWATSLEDPDRGSTPRIGDDPEFLRAVRERLEDATKFPGVEGVIFFQNVTLDSSRLGESTAVVFGPECTFTAAHVAGAVDKPLVMGSAPSNFQYGQWYITRAAHLAELAAARPHQVSEVE